MQWHLCFNTWMADERMMLWAQDEDRTATMSLSWAMQLAKYLQHAPGTSSTQLAADRRSRAEALQSSPMSAEAWSRFLETEERIASGAEPSASALKARPAGSITLAHLYQRATELVPRVRGKAPEDYMQIWIGHARQQW